MAEANPFSAKSGWNPKVFTGRDEEFKLFEKKLREAEKGKCDHFLILGDWGIGKTALLKEFKKRAKEKFLTEMITIRKFREEEGLIDATIHLVKSITSELPVEEGKLKKLWEKISSIGVQVLGTGFDITKSSMRATDPQLFLLSSLQGLWEDLKDTSKVIVILIDDVQNFDRISEVFTVIKNVLSNDKIVETGFLFILSCTPDGWAKFMQLHHPIGRYFTPRLTLKRLSKQETLEMVNKTLKGTGVEFVPEIKEMMYEYTQGHPYEVQALGASLYEREIKGRVTKTQWLAALNETMITLGEDIWDGLYDEASENEKQILYLVSLPSHPVSRKTIVELIKKYDLDIQEANISKFLGRLVNKGLLCRPKKFEYACVDKLFREYVLTIKGLDGEGTVLL